MDEIVDVVNLTDHPVTLADENDVGRTVTLAPGAGPVPRVEIGSMDLGRVRLDGVSLPLLWRPLQCVVNLPAPVTGRLLIVSNLVVMACPEREDLVFPTRMLRGQDGKIVAARALARA
jgi:hypothetical protein